MKCKKALIGTCDVTRLHVVLGTIKLYARIDYYHALLFKSIFIGIGWTTIDYILKEYFDIISTAIFYQKIFV